MLIGIGFIGTRLYHFYFPSDETLVSYAAESSESNGFKSGSYEDRFYRALVLEMASERARHAALDFVRSGDVESGINTLLPVARAGSSSAIYMLAQIYRDMLGDYTSSVRWTQEAAKQGHVQSMAMLGAYYMKGFVVDQDFDESFYWLKKAAEKGHVGGELALGYHYAYGLGVQSDLEKAFGWYMRAADHGNRDAMNEIGKYFIIGSVVPHDYAMALRYFEESASMGNRDALYSAGLIHALGFASSSDISIASRLLGEAAALGDDRAASALSCIGETSSSGSSSDLDRHPAASFGGFNGEDIDVTDLIYSRECADGSCVGIQSCLLQ